MEMIHGFTFGIVGGLAVGFIYAHVRYINRLGVSLKAYDESDLVDEVKRRRIKRKIIDEVNKEVEKECQG